MKKLICIILCLSMLGLSSCGVSTSKESKTGMKESTAAVDVDLTALSSTMVYSEVYNMLCEPKDYVGKTIKMQGSATSLEGSDGKWYFACIIQDATACCSQGMEYLLEGKESSPNEYPKDGEEITVVGTFSLYLENGMTYCTLKDAKLI